MTHMSSPLLIPLMGNGLVLPSQVWWPRNEG